MEDLARYARERARRSAKRNGVLEWAYWRETASWAERAMYQDDDDADYRILAARWAHAARECAAEGNFLLAARNYSRAKWYVILARNNGLKMSTEVTGVNLRWLREFEAEKRGE